MPLFGGNRKDKRKHTRKVNIYHMSALNERLVYKRLFVCGKTEKKILNKPVEQKRDLNSRQQGTIT